MTRSSVQAFVGLGSNLGDRLANLQEAVRRLASTEGVTVRRCSRVYETAPVGPPQPDFLNAVAEVETSLPPRALLEACLGVEAAMGRERAERWGPRVIDLDLLTFGDAAIDEPGITVPHPRMHERAFVLVPLLELDPDPILPGGLRVGTLRLDPAVGEGVRPFAAAISVPAQTVPRPADSPGARTRPEASMA